MPRSCVGVSVTPAGDARKVSLNVLDASIFKAFPGDARIKLRLTENKVSETLEFGTVEVAVGTAVLKNPFFTAPSCHLRVVASEADNKGLLLGSTDTWTLRTNTDGDGEAKDEGILLFQPKDIAPRVWAIDIRQDENPIIYVDKSIPDAKLWARNDQVFVSAVLPAIIHRIFDYIISEGALDDTGWIRDWLTWADDVMPGIKPPSKTDGYIARVDWIDKLVDTFAFKHKSLERLRNIISSGEKLK